MTDQLILGIAVLVFALLVLYEFVETWRWRGPQNRPPSRFRVVRWVRRAFAGAFAIFTFRRSSGRHVAREETMSAYDLARRLGDATIGTEEPGPVHLRPGRIVVSGAGAPVRQPVQPVTPVPPPRPPRPSRARLVRDTVGAALVLGGLVVAFANFVPRPPQGNVEGVTATPKPTPVIVTSLPPSQSPAAVATRSPEPTATIESGPTPTLSPALVSSTPTPTPRPTARPTARSTAAPQPTIAPTRAPTPRPTPKPTRKPTPTPVPAARILTLTASAPAIAGSPVTVTFTTANAETFSISFSDGSSIESGAVSGGAGSIDHTFQDAGEYDVVLTVSGLGEPDTQPVHVSVQ